MTGEGKLADRSGPAPGGACTNRRGLGAERAYVVDFRRSEPLDLGRTVAMGCVEVLQLDDRCFLSAAGKSPETRQTRSLGDLGSSVQAGMG
jgi:hypothetical protein